MKNVELKKTRVSRVKISIAMTTYNGEKYICDQLRSILSQTRQPDEIIVCDDCSTDSTVNTVKEFMLNQHSKIDWKVHVNKENLGFTENFLKSASMTSGDIIFFSDQDDIWDARKIESMYEVIRSKNCSAVICSFLCINENGENNNTLLNYLRLGLGRTKKLGFSYQIKKLSCSGMALCVKRNLLMEGIPIIRNHKLTFDTPLGLLAAAKGELYWIQKNLVRYRVHSSNTSTPHYSIASRLKDKEYNLLARKTRLKNYYACKYELNKYLSERESECLNKEIHNIEHSISYLEKRDSLNLFKQLLVYNPMSNFTIKLLNLLLSII